MKLIEEAAKHSKDLNFFPIANPANFSLNDPKGWKAAIVLEDRLAAVEAMLTEPLQAGREKLKELYEKCMQAADAYVKNFDAVKHSNPQYYAALVTANDAVDTIKDLMRLDLKKGDATVGGFEQQSKGLDATRQSATQAGPYAAGAPAYFMTVMSHLIEAHPSLKSAGSPTSTIPALMAAVEDAWRGLGNYDDATATEKQKDVIAGYEAVQKNLKKIRELLSAAKLNHQTPTAAPANDPGQKAV